MKTLTIHETTIAVAMVVRGYKAADILRRFPGAEWEDVRTAVHAHSPALPLPTPPDPAQNGAASSKTGGLEALVAQSLQLAVDLECTLQGLGGVLDKAPTEAQLLEFADNLEHEWKQQHMVTPLHQVLVHVLYSRYALIPRPFLVPVDDISKSHGKQPSPT